MITVQQVETSPGLSWSPSPICSGATLGITTLQRLPSTQCHQRFHSCERKNSTPVCSNKLPEERDEIIRSAELADSAPRASHPVDVGQRLQRGGALPVPRPVSVGIEGGSLAVKRNRQVATEGAFLGRCSEEEGAVGLIGGEGIVTLGTQSWFGRRGFTGHAVL